MVHGIARQAIYNTKKQVMGYELLFRMGNTNHFPKGFPPQQATQCLVDLLLSDNKTALKNIASPLPCFINFSQPCLQSHVPLKFHPDEIVIEILESAVPDAHLLRIVTRLNKMGYQIALDDFTFTQAWLPFLPLVDFIKLDFRATDLSSIRTFITTYSPLFNFKLIAEKIESQEELQFAEAMDFDFFQGYQMSKPEIVLNVAKSG